MIVGIVVAFVASLHVLGNKDLGVDGQRYASMDCTAYIQREKHASVLRRRCRRRV